MKRLILIVIACVALAALVADLAYVRFFSGQGVAEDVVFYDASQGAQVLKLDIAPEDLPVRLNLKVYGARERMDIFHNAELNFKTGLSAEGDTVLKNLIVDEKDDVSRTSAGFGNFTLHQSEYANRAQTSIVFETATPGQWDLTVALGEQINYEVKRIVGDVRTGTAVIDWIRVIVLMMIVFAASIMAARLKPRDAGAHMPA